MGLDTLLKRFFPLVVCAFIGVAAYFQASGMGQLVAASVAAPAAPASPSLPSKVAPAIRPAKSAGPILSRNAFDSITGPLDGKPVGDVPAAPVRNSDNPYEDPACDQASATLITASDDPAWSFAAIQTSDGSSQLRRLGDAVGTLKVHHIGWFPNAPDPRPRVWLSQNGASRCQIDLNAEKKAEGAPKAAAPGQPRVTPKGGAGGVPPEIAEKIHKVSDTEWNLDRSVVDEILKQQAQLMRSVRMRPVADGGMRLSGIRSDSLLGTLGLKNGDQLKSINGFDMSDPEKALEAYSRLKTADKMKVSVVRGGADVNLDYHIK